MATTLDIINDGLRKLGEQTITSVAESSPAARLASATYDGIQDALFREFPWNFAMTRASITAEVTTPTWGYAREYALPALCMRLVDINNVDDEDWTLELGMILTDKTSPLEIKYVARVEPDDMDPTFREALAAKLAVEWAEPLSQTSSVVAAMFDLYRNKLQVARTADGQENRPGVIDAPDFINARY